MMRFGLVFLIVVAIVGTAWFVGDRQGFGDIGQGGVNANLLPKVGDQAPELITFDTEMKPVRLSEFRGQPVWLNFWGSWCAPCRAEFPEIQDAWETLQPRGLIMLGIAIKEDPWTAKDYADRVGGTFPVLGDPAFIRAQLGDDIDPEVLKILTGYTIYNYPTHIFIDRDGIVQKVIIAPMSYEEAVANGEAVLGPEAPPVVSPVSATPPSATPTD